MKHVYTPANLHAMRSAGLRSLAYRLRTELGCEAWHWNPLGTWSDPERRQGYWTSSDHANAPILTCYGYRLPRRGNTLDQANNDGYSRLDDGDPTTFWKSNPYLDRHFTGEDNARHPQWIVADFGKRILLNAARILWGTPYATRYRIEYWQSEDDPEYLNDIVPGCWQAFPDGVVTNGRSGSLFLRLSHTPIAARYVRIWLLESSGTAPSGSRDVRDGLGYAVRELSLGTLDKTGAFHDAIRHGKSSRTQTILFTSSTDPWHRASDRDRRVEQPGFDRVFRSGLTSSLPMLTPVGLLYDTPENAVAELRFLRGRGYPVQQIELGEEPDGQYTTPEDYAALYLQWANAIHAVDPTLQLGGPGFQTATEGWHVWADQNGNVSWVNRFLNFLRARQRLRDLNFLSFEWYPFDDLHASCAAQLLQAPELLEATLRRFKQAGVPADLPCIITEYGYSSYARRAEVELASALLNAEIVGQFLTLGGKAAYLYGYEPNPLIHEKQQPDTWGNMALFLSDANRHIRCPLPIYYGARLLTQIWTGAADKRHEVYPAVSDVRNRRGQTLVTAYALHRPDGKWAILLLNKDSRHAHAICLRFHDTKSGMVGSLRGVGKLSQYSPAQYLWRAADASGYPRRNLPPTHRTLHFDGQTLLSLPAWSLTVVCGSKS